MHRIRILLVVVAATVVLFAGAAPAGSASAGRAAPQPTRTVRLRSWRLSFRAPRAWKVQHFDDSSSFSTLIAYLSPLRLHDPCTRTTTAAGEQISCGDPLASLPTGGVLITWANVGFPHAADEPEIPDPNATIAGQPAHVETLTNVAAPGVCGSLTADVAVTAAIARPIGNHFEMIACLRDPGAARTERQVQTMLHSVRIR